jgi:hypothetical protein
MTGSKLGGKASTLRKAPDNDSVRWNARISDQFQGGAHFPER